MTGDDDIIVSDKNLVDEPKASDRPGDLDNLRIRVNPRVLGVRYQ